MTYTVVWKPIAERRLGEIWITAQDRAAVTTAADSIDRQLKLNPSAVGESRSGRERVVIDPPLVVYYEVLEEDRIVNVLWIIYTPQRPTDG